MRSKRLFIRIGLVALVILTMSAITVSQETQPGSEEEFGPVVRAYLGYLKDEQEVVDDRASRHEISTRYYRRNSNRIRALRQTALSIARETKNDYLPELEAAVRDELKSLFDAPPKPGNFRVGQVLNNTFRYLGQVRAGEVFYVFARLDPYEQAERIEKEKSGTSSRESQSGTSVPVVSSGPMLSQPQPSGTGSP